MSAFSAVRERLATPRAYVAGGDRSTRRVAISSFLRHVVGTCRRRRHQACSYARQINGNNETLAAARPDTSPDTSPDDTSPDGLHACRAHTSPDGLHACRRPHHPDGLHACRRSRGVEVGWIPFVRFGRESFGGTFRGRRGGRDARPGWDCPTILSGESHRLSRASTAYLEFLRRTRSRSLTAWTGQKP